MHWLCDNLSLPQCRQVRSRLLEVPPIPLGVFERLLLQEEAAAGAVQMPKEARELFERTLAEHGASAVSVWVRYAAWHLRGADFAAASTVHRRALRALAEEHSAAFVAAFEAQRSDLGAMDS